MRSLSIHQGMPGFITRGLATLSDPRDLTTVRFATEAELRDAMALTWWLHGWDVRTEVKVPDCGRLDVFAQAGSQRVIIELKKKIETPTEARMACQQVFTYASYLTAGRPQLAHMFVTAGRIDLDACRSAEEAFDGVWCNGFVQVGALAGQLNSYGDGNTGELLARVARNRRDELASLASLAAGCANVVTNRHEMRLIEGGASA